MNCKVIAISHENVKKVNLISQIREDYRSAYDYFLEEFGEVRIMAHELKTPLNGLGFFQLLEGEYRGLQEDDFIVSIRQFQEEVFLLSAGISEVTGVGYDLSYENEKVNSVFVKNIGQISSEDINLVKHSIDRLKNESSQFRSRYEKVTIDAKLLLERLKQDFRMLYEAVDPELLSDEGKMFVGMIMDSVEVLLGIVSVDADGVREASMISMVSRIQESLERMYPDKDVQVHYDGPDMLRINYSSVYQVVNNLVTNAVKYNSNDPIVKIVASQNESGLVFEVSDNGIGIDPEYHELIFEKNQRVPNVASKFEGSGIGLDVVKTKVEDMGGSIRVESQVGNGSSFFFNLPYSYN